MAIEMERAAVIRRPRAYPALKPGSPEWNALRPTLIGASEVPGLYPHDVSEDQYHSRFTVWLHKTGQFVEDPQSPDSPASIGSAFESAIAGIYCRMMKEHGVKYITPSWTEHDEQLEILAATPDFDVFSDLTGDRIHTLQVKNRGGMPRGWGEQGTDVVPRPVLIQVHSELTVTKKQYEDVVAMLSGNRYVQYRIWRDDSVSENIREVTDSFWRTYVVPRVQPPIEGPAANDFFDKKFPRSTAELIVPATTEEQVNALQEYRLVKELAKQLEMRAGDAEAVIKSMIGENYGLQHAKVGKAIWYNQDGRKTISEDSLRAALFESDLDVGTIDSVVEKATKVGKPFRVAKFYPAK